MDPDKKYNSAEASGSTESGETEKQTHELVMVRVEEEESGLWRDLLYLTTCRYTAGA